MEMQRGLVFARLQRDRRGIEIPRRSAGCGHHERRNCAG